MNERLLSLGADPSFLSRPARLGGTTPVPNVLFDAVMPTLSDTQLRVLLIVARSTLGWQDGEGRKEQDWLSHRQLQKRSGRAGAAVSGAIDVLVQRGLLDVQDGTGERRSTPSARRAVRGPLFYRLGQELTSQKVLTSQSEVMNLLDSQTHEQFNQISERSSPKVRNLEFDSTSERRLHKAKTTKEKETKERKEYPEINLDLSSLGSEVLRIDAERIAGLKGTPLETQMLTEQARNSTAVETSGGAGLKVPYQSCLVAPSEDEGISDETEAFLRRFQVAYCEAHNGQPCPPIEEADRVLLKRYLETYGASMLEPWLPAFFASSFGYVRRRAWSLGAFLNSVFVLQAQKNKINRDL